MWPWTYMCPPSSMGYSIPQQPPFNMFPGAPQHPNYSPSPPIPMASPTYAKISNPVCNTRPHVDKSRTFKTWREGQGNFKRCLNIFYITGREAGFAFLTKFEKFATILEWEETDKRDYLCLCITGKVSEYFTLITENQEDLAFEVLLEKLERHFGFKEFPRQQWSPSPMLARTRRRVEDWADRVLTLAGKAYRDLADDFANKQSILRICMGAKDKEAGEQVVNQRPASMERAIDQIKWAIHTHGLIFSPHGAKHVAEDSPKVTEVRTRGKTSERFDKLEKRVGRLKEKVDLILSKIDKMRPIRRSSSFSHKRSTFLTGEHVVKSVFFQALNKKRSA